MKDLRKVYTNQPIQLEGNTVHFDGKYNPETKTLKVYRYYGDITLREQALQDFCIVNNFDKVILMS